MTAMFNFTEALGIAGTAVAALNEALGIEPDAPFAERAYLTSLGHGATGGSATINVSHKIYSVFLPHPGRLQTVDGDLLGAVREGDVAGMLALAAEVATFTKGARLGRRFR